MGDLLILPMTVHINESSMANILYFPEVVNITGVRIKMNTAKEKFINVHIKDGKFIHFKVCSEGLFYINIGYPSMISNTNNVSVDSYSYLSTVKQDYGF